MTTTTDLAGRARGASPVDFETYGDYGSRLRARQQQDQQDQQDR